MEKDHEEYNIGVLDIYGFEIFQVKTSELVMNLRMVAKISSLFYWEWAIACLIHLLL